MKHYRVHINGKSYEVAIEELEGISDKPTIKPTNPTPALAARNAPKVAEVLSTVATGPTSDDKSIIAPMPGTVLRIAAASGDRVQKGDTLLILEAMKMENEILAPADGQVKEVKVAQGASVNAGDQLIVIH